MKKVLFAVAVIGFVMTSCKKDYTCECKSSGQTLNASILDAKKKDAQTACDNLAATYKLGDPQASCTLK